MYFPRYMPARRSHMPYDALIIGGGPAGLSAAVALGRARKRVLLCDSGPRRNTAAIHIHNFVTRDGTPPDTFRQVARQQLEQYPSVEVRDAGVQSVAGSCGAFHVTTSSGVVEARRILLCVGMVDEMLSIEGFEESWGRSIFQCPYCHGWEVRDRRWGYLARSVEAFHFVPVLRGWTRDVVVFTSGAFEVPAEALARFDARGIQVETRAIARLSAPGGSLDSVVLADGVSVPCEALFAHPPQRQVDLVRDLALALDADGFVRVDPMTRETSVPGVYAAGDLTSRMQAAIVAAATGTHAAGMLNHELTDKLAASGLL